MSKPVNKEEFWKKRIETAQKEHYSVYVVTDTGWKKIFKEHSRIIDQHIDGKVLDAGCGYGRMCELFKPKNYVGVDFSQDFINKASEKYPLYPFFKENLKDLHFKDKEFDWAFCISIKKMIEDNLGKEEWEKIEKELKRVADKVLILEYEEPEKYEII